MCAYPSILTRLHKKTKKKKCTRSLKFTKVCVPFGDLERQPEPSYVNAHLQFRRDSVQSASFPWPITFHERTKEVGGARAAKATRPVRSGPAAATLQTGGDDMTFAVNETGTDKSLCASHNSGWGGRGGGREGGMPTHRFYTRS